jgi:hypothetical protein
LLGETTEKYLNAEKIPAVPLASSSFQQSTTEMFLEAKKSEHEGEINCLESDTLECNAKNSTIDSRFVFDAPCKDGFRRDRNNNCRKVHRK